MRVLTFAASLRATSLNKKLITVAAELVRSKGYEVDLADFGEFDMPLYHGDLDGNGGLPPGAIALKDRVIAADAIVIATPEYNYSIAGPLKNAFDWVSRARPMPWRGRSVYLMSASPSPMGGIRGLWQTRIPFEGCGSLVFPDMFALPHAHEAFDENGKLRDEQIAQRLDKELTGFVRLAEAAADICGDKATVPDRQKKIADALEEETEIQTAAE